MNDIMKIVCATTVSFSMAMSAAALLSKDEPEKEKDATPVSSIEVQVVKPEYVEPDHIRFMRYYCDVYGCPFHLAMATAKVESNFDQSVVGSSGEVGMMQILPGPDGKYHNALYMETGMDPTTYEGNIACGCYVLGKYYRMYGDEEKASMAYNMGEGGAKSLWDIGITSTTYSRNVREATHDYGA